LQQKNENSLKENKKLNYIINEHNIEIEQQAKVLELEREKVVQKTVDLLVLNRALRENLKLHDGLTSMIVHDLKNPISNIINLSRNKEVLFFANEILTMVENILDVKKYEGMLMPIKKEAVLLKQIIVDATKQIILFAERKNIKIINKINNNIIVSADEEILRRVIVNFLSNSVKYSYANGKILIDFEIVEDNRVLIKIIDEGIGIKHNKIDLIFNKFSQIVAKKTGSARSTGLGLTFCKMAIQAHGSEIFVESKPNKYTTFSFSIETLKEKKTINKDIKTEKTNDKFILNKEDKTYLRKFQTSLKKLEVYEISELKIVLKQIDEKQSCNIAIWKNKISTAIFNCNFELYKELIDKI